MATTTTNKRDASVLADDPTISTDPATSKPFPPKREPTIEQKNREAKQSKRMKKLLQTDPAAAEQRDYRHRIGLARRDHDVAGALQLFADVQARDIDIGPESFNTLIGLLTTFEKDAEADVAFEYMRKKGVALTEATYVSMIRSKSLTGGQPETGEALLEEMIAAKQRPRLRSYSPIVVGYAQQEGKLEKAFATYEKMLQREVEPSECELLALLKACTAAKDTGKFHIILRKMQELVFEPSRETWDGLIARFASSSPSSKITHPTTIDKTGVCAACHETLDSIDLPPQSLQALMEMVEELVLADTARTQEWQAFKVWLQRAAEQEKFDMVIDGANVGYYQMNYADAPSHVNYEQISWVLNHFINQGKKPLLVLHARHVDDRRVPHQYKSLVGKWKAGGYLFVVPYRNNDDWFWLYATVYKGGRTLVVTNDEMRDHHFQMLSQRTFLRWKERHQVYFSFGGYDNAREGRTVQIRAPAVYSRCMQGPGTLTTPLKEGENEEEGKAFWHVPLAESEEWLCIQVGVGEGGSGGDGGGSGEGSEKVQ